MTFEVELEMVIRLLLAALLGAIVGIERELAHKPAGLRTHMMVCMGSALFTIISILAFGDERLAAGIVTGVGFIGAGSIIGTKGQPHGITTAASLWIVAAIGIGVGAGAYLLSIVTSIISFLVLELRKFEKIIYK